MRFTHLFAFCAMPLLYSMVSISGFAQQHKTSLLIIVTSVDHFPDGKPTGMWLEEYAIPYEMMLKQGYELTVVSPKGGVSPVDPRSAAKGDQDVRWANAQRARRNTVKLTDSIKALDCDAVFIPGGHGPLFDLATDPISIRIISEFARAGKPVASVCHGPAALVEVTLANGDPLVRGRKVTAFSDSEEKAADVNAVVPFSVQQRLTALGGQYSKGENFKEYVVEDGTLILGQNPPSSAKVAQLLINQLEAKKKAPQPVGAEQARPQSGVAQSGEATLQEPRQVAAAVVAEAMPAPKLVVSVGAHQGEFLEVFLNRFPNANGLWIEPQESVANHNIDAAKARLGRLGERVSYRIGAYGRDISDGSVPDSADVICTDWMSINQNLDGIYRIYSLMAERLPGGGMLVNLDHVGYGGTPWESRLKLASKELRPQQVGPPIKFKEIRVPTVEEQLGAMRAAGFDARVVWQSFDLVLFVGRKM